MNKWRLMGMALAALALGGGAVTVWSAATATTRESDQVATPPRAEQRQERPYRPDGMREGMREGMRPMNRPGWFRDAASRPISLEEWQEIDQFMNANSPKRWAKFREMPDDERKEKLRGFVAQRYRNMQELWQNDRTMYDLRRTRLGVEDQIFDLGWQLNHDPANPDEVRSKLRTAVRALVESRVEERKLRVKQLKGRLEMEQQRLAEDEADKDRAIDASMAAIGRQRWPGMGEMVPPLPPQRPLRDPRNLAPANPQGNAPANPPANASEQGKQ